MIDKSISKEYSVKARKHYGSNTFDLTIPTVITKKFDIAEGDIFIVKIVNDQGNQDENLILEYKRVYSHLKK